MSKYNSRLIEEHPADTLVRVRGLLAVHQSIDWDNATDAANGGSVVLLDEAVAALGHVISQIGEVQREHFEN